MKYNTALVLIGALLGPLSADAHDFWLEAHPYRVKSGDMVEVSVHVGTRMRGNILPNIPPWYEDFSFIDQRGRHPVDGEMGRDPAGVLVAGDPGLIAIGYRSVPKFVELEPERFRKYLSEEGLDAVRQAFDELDPVPASAPEFYTRYVKTYVEVGDTDGSTIHHAAFGFALELMPLQNPYRLSVGDAWSLRLDYLGSPLPGATVFAFTTDEPDAVQRVATDAGGVAVVRIDRPGVWLVKATHMVPVQREDADWESLWASVTFEQR